MAGELFSWFNWNLPEKSTFVPDWASVYNEGKQPTNKPVVPYISPWALSCNNTQPINAAYEAVSRFQKNLLTGFGANEYFG